MYESEFIQIESKIGERRDESMANFAPTQDIFCHILLHMLYMQPISPKERSR